VPRMTHNNSYDRELIDQIDRLMREGQPSGDPLLDALAGSQPQPDDRFRHELEQQLMLQAEKHHHKRDNRMNNGQKKKSGQARRFTKWHGLAAAIIILVIMLAGALRFLVAPAPSDPVNLALTSTAIVADITRTFETGMTRTAAAVMGIPDFAQATQTAQQRFMSPPTMPLDPTRPPDNFELTATQMVAQITQTIAGAQADTLQALSTPAAPDLQATATQIVADLTATAADLTAAQLDQERARSVPVIFALEAIAAGTTIERDMVGRLYVPRPLVDGSEAVVDLPEDFPGFIGDFENVVGQLAADDIPAFSIIIPDQIARDEEDE